VRPVVLLGAGEDLDTSAVLAVADGARVEFTLEFLTVLAERRTALLAALERSGPVYGVTTGMGAMAGIALDAAARSRHQDHLVVGRAVGSAPWLSPKEVRALLAVRLRTFLHPEAAVSTGLLLRLADLLARDVLPAVPARGGGAAGEIVPLAHAGAVVLGGGRTLGGNLRAEDVRPENSPPGYSFAAKEGVAFLEGVPGATALALLRGRSAADLLRRGTLVLAASAEVLRASHDPVHPGLARGDDVLADVLAGLRALRPAGDVHGLQAPVSVRVGAAALATAHRAVAALAAAAERALVGVSDSPAFLGGDFVGSAGFAGTDLAAGLDHLTAALVHVADTSAARTHRMLDTRLTGLPPQLSPKPGVQAGLVAVHKRAVGVVHRLRRFAVPALLGPVETSLGQEDVQSFAFEAAECAAEALAGLTEVLAVELLAVHRAGLLRGGLSGLSPVAQEALGEVADLLGGDVLDRPYGIDVDAVADWLVRPSGTGR